MISNASSRKLHVCSIKNRKWTDLVLANFFQLEHEKEEKKTKTENVGNFRKLAKIFAIPAKFRRALLPKLIPNFNRP